jgi:hypothetical protein
MPGLGVGMPLLEGDVFHAAHGFHGHEIRPGALPTARQRGTVKIHQQASLGRICQDVLVIGHGRLRVTREEVHLDARDADGANLRELGASAFAGQQAVARCERRGVPGAGRVVPDEDLHALGLAVFAYSTSSFRPS